MRNHRIPGKSTGFSLIEILVTLLIISIALLGAAGMQSQSMKLNQGGQFRTQAVFLVADLVERMDANKPGAINGGYVLNTSSTANTLSTACSTGGTCTSAALATYDLSAWQNVVAATLPQSSWAVVQDVTGNPSTYRITINWVERKVDTTYSATTSGEAMSYTATRTIFN